MQMQGRAEYIKRCGPKLVRNTVMHSGNGAMEVRWVTDLKYKDGVAVRTRYVVLPAGVSAVSAKVTETNEFSKEVWVPMPEMTELLKGLAK